MKALLFGLFSLMAATTHAASTDTVQIPVEQKVVEIHMTNTQPPSSAEIKRRKKQNLPYLSHATCSGAFIDSVGDILTAKHCVEGFDELAVVTFDQKTYVATVVAKSSAHDLALIHIDRRFTAYFQPAQEVRRGEAVFVLGSPLGITDTLSTGIVARLDGDLTFIDCAALPGNSGSPVFNKDQKLIGVLTAGVVVLFGTTHLNIVQGLDAVTFFVIEAFGLKANGR